MVVGNVYKVLDQAVKELAEQNQVLLLLATFDSSLNWPSRATVTKLKKEDENGLKCYKRVLV